MAYMLILVSGDSPIHIDELADQFRNTANHCEGSLTVNNCTCFSLDTAYLGRYKDKLGPLARQT